MARLAGLPFTAVVWWGVCCAGTAGVEHGFSQRLPRLDWAIVNQSNRRIGRKMNMARCLRFGLFVGVMVLGFGFGVASVRADGKQDAVAAYKRGDYGTAVQLFRPLAVNRLRVPTPIGVVTF
jgi:hypothetical protein